ncbi:MAG: SRPBCC family protein [Saprospiraceae bacterium]
MHRHIATTMGMIQTIDPDIREARTLSANIYRDQPLFDKMRNDLFRRSWQWLGDRLSFKDGITQVPANLLPGFLDTPLVLTQREHQLQVLSNVCTHRASLMVDEPRKGPLIKCPYHGRCFGLDGTFRSMPEFELTANFPSEKDHLRKLPSGILDPLVFTSMDPRWTFDEVFQDMRDWMAFYPWDQLYHYNHTVYTVEAHWALYCDNYLEGFHVPYVHPGLNASLDMPSYETRLFPYSNIQIGIAGPGEPHLDVPQDHPFGGQSVYAFYWWVFPNMMFNFYPWGLSMNVVTPESLTRTCIHYHTYLKRDADAEAFHRTGIHQTELEDEAIVEKVQLGITSGLYDAGRFSPTQEKGVHHFHQLLAQWI